MPLINVKKFWTPLEIFGVKLYKCRNKQNYYYKTRKSHNLIKL
ncbi:hypothetical protein PMEGAPR185_34030 [Priestia megaterium]